LMLVEPGLEGEEDSVFNFPKLMFLMWHNLAMIARYNYLDKAFDMLVGLLMNYLSNILIGLNLLLN
jgi:hypothetical protein